MTQEQFRKELGVTNKTIFRWENGNYMLDVEMLSLLSIKFGVSINELISGGRLLAEDFKKIAANILVTSLNNSIFMLKEKRAFFKRKLLHELTNAYDCICIEDLDMKAMSQSLNFGKPVSDNGRGMFTTFLKYKLEEQGKRLVKVDRFFASSQTCNICGYKNPETRSLAVRAWDCPRCGTHHDRDVNTVINIGDEGMRLVTV